MRVGPKIKIVLIIILPVIVIFGISIIILSYRSTPVKEDGLDKVYQQYQERIAKADNSSFDLVKKGNRLLQAKEVKLAIVPLVKATEKDSNYRDAYLLLGYAYLLNKEAQNALTALEIARSLDPINPVTYKLLGTAYEDLGMQENATLCYNKYNELNGHFSQNN